MTKFAQKCLAPVLFFVISAINAQPIVLSGKIASGKPPYSIQLNRVNYANKSDVRSETVSADSQGLFMHTFSEKEALIYELKIHAVVSCHLLLAPGDSVFLRIGANGAVEVFGSPETRYLLDYENKRKQIYADITGPVMQAMQRETASGNGIDTADWSKKEREAVQNYKAALSRWVANDKILQSRAAIHHTLRCNPETDMPLMEKMLKYYQAAYPDTELARQMEELVQRAKQTLTGMKAPIFTSLYPDGSKYVFSPNPSGYVLLDFWAAWCGPCRMANPILVKLYEKYKNKGLDIVSVSVDDHRDKWLAAVKKDGMTWTQVSELTGWGGNAAKLYNVTAIPTSFLIDSRGVIIENNLHGEDLAKKLDELLGGRY